MDLKDRWDLTEFFKNENEFLSKVKEFGMLAEKIRKYKEIVDKDPKCVYDFFEFEDLIFFISRKFEFYLDMLEYENYKNLKLPLFKKEYTKVQKDINDAIKEVKNVISFCNFKYFLKLYPKLKKYRNNLYDTTLIDDEENLKTKLSELLQIRNNLMNDIVGANADEKDYALTFSHIFDLYFKTLAQKKDFLEDDANAYGYQLSDLFWMIDKVKEKADLNFDACAILEEADEMKKRKIKLPDAKTIITSSFEVFGSEYLNKVKSIFNSRHIDYYPRQNKSDENITFTYPLLESFATINYKDNVYAVSTLAHEIGHMVEFDMKRKCAPFSTGNVTISTEFFSIFNELVVSDYMLKKANTLDEKLELTCHVLSVYFDNLILPPANITYFNAIFNEVKKGNALEQNKLNNILFDVADKFYLDWTNDDWINFSFSERILDDSVYFFGIICAAKALKMLNNNEFNIKEFMHVLKRECDGNMALLSLGCNPYDNIDVALNEYEKIIENSKDLLYEKQKVLRRKNGNRI